MIRNRIIVSLAVASVALGVTSCKTSAGNALSDASATASASASRPPPAVAPVKPWFSGGFSGQYQAKLAAVEIKAGAAKEWTKDDGKLASGPGKIELEIDDAGQVAGTSEGALGAGHVGGKVEDDTLRVQLSPTDDAGLHGVLVASRDGDGFKGSIEASSGDSLTVRTASIELKKSPVGDHEAHHEN